MREQIFVQIFYFNKNVQKWQLKKKNNFVIKMLFQQVLQLDYQSLPLQLKKKYQCDGF